MNNEVLRAFLLPAFCLPSLNSLAFLLPSFLFPAFLLPSFLLPSFLLLAFLLPAFLLPLSSFSSSRCPYYPPHPLQCRTVEDSRIVSIRPFSFSSARALQSLSQVGRWRENRVTRVSATVRSMAVDSRPEMMATAPYSPPSWASKLSPAPSQIVSLGQLNTPIHRWNLPRLPEGTEVWIKRDDLTGMQLSGNKVRKLEFIMADAKAQGADCVITTGGLQSNHCRATAVAARYLGLKCYLLLSSSRTIVDNDPGLEGNLLIDRLVGADVLLVSKEEHSPPGSLAPEDLLVEKLKKKGKTPYVIPVGGSNSLGTWGYVEFVRELQNQLEGGKVSGLEHVDDIVMACGSGGTTAGIAIGNHLSKLGAKVHAYVVRLTPEYFDDYVKKLLKGLKVDVETKDIVRLTNAIGKDYGESTTEELELIQEVAESTGIILDPVYSGKALNGMLKDMAENPSRWEGRKVLFVHTGGLLGMYDKVEQLQKLVNKCERF